MKMYVYLLMAVAGLAFEACFDPKQGCLDAAATNFDAAADEDCCCEYPNLVLEFRQRFGTDPFDPNKVYLSTANKPFYLRGTSFYFSDFEVLRGNEVFSVPDTLTLRAFAPTGKDTLRELYQNDFALARSSGQIDSKIGRFRTDGTFDGVRFRLGLNDNAQRVIAPLAPAGHPLAIQTDSLWYGRATGYVFAQLVVQRDTASANAVRDTLAFTAADIGAFIIEKKGTTFTKRVGYDFRLILIADYQMLLDGVDWSKGDKNTWKSQVVQNLSKAFSVTQ